MMLHERHWPIDHPQAVIALVHGAGEHGARYVHFAATMNRAGYAVFGCDLPGHGQSEGLRGHIESFELYLDALDYTFQQIETVYPNLPIVLFGHSMGGLVCVRFMQTRQPPKELKAVVLTSPCLDLVLPVPPVKVRLAKILNRVWPSLRQPNGIKPSDVSRSAEISGQYASDPLIVTRASARWFIELQNAMFTARSTNTVFPVATMILQAGEDRVVSSEATQKFSEALEAPNKSFRLYPQCYHELLNEPEREQIMNEILVWLKQLSS